LTQLFSKKVRGDSRVAKWDRNSVSNPTYPNSRLLVRRTSLSTVHPWAERDIYWLSAFVGSNPTPRTFSFFTKKETCAKKEKVSRLATFFGVAFF
jgi:hypothetical protein